MFKSFLVGWLLLLSWALQAQPEERRYVQGVADTLIDDAFYLIKRQHISPGDVVKRIGRSAIVKGKEVRPKETALRVNDQWKLSGEGQIGNNQLGSYYVRLYDSRQGLSDTGTLVVTSTADSSLLMIEGAWKEIEQRLLPNKNVVFIQPADRRPRAESSVRQHDLSVNTINLAHHAYPELRGRGLAVSIKEDAFDPLDIDLASRAITDSQTSNRVDRHATEMATLVGGAGYTSPRGQGVADQASLYSASFSSLLPEPDAYYRSRSITVQNHSYGTDIENFYGVEAATYDASTQKNSPLLHVFSVGNQGRQTGTGPYEGVASYGTVTGSFKQAKNVLLVSSTDSSGRVPEQNSRGPAYDGRIKPDLVAFGGEGTSEAAALVSGSALLLQESYHKIEGAWPTSAMVRALLIAGSDEVGEAGPDFTSGHGQLNLFRSLQLLDSGRYDSGRVSTGETQRLELTIPPGTASASFVLTWNDPPARDGDDVALVNDLDLRIQREGQTFLPWVLDATPQEDRLARPATTGVDRLNNVEKVTLRAPSAGRYTVVVAGATVTSPQSYSLAYSVTAANSFRWTFPTSSDPVGANQQKWVRWRTPMQGSGTLEIDYLRERWETLATVSLASGVADVLLPDTTALARLRMVTSQGTFVSDTFLVSPPVALKVDLNCTDNLLLTWTAVEGATYSVRQYDHGDLKEVASTADTFLLLNPSEGAGRAFSVYPTVSGRTARPSSLINADQQGIGCYINSFLAARHQDVVELRLDLAGVSLIREVQILKRVRGGTPEVLGRLRPTTRYYTWEDTEPEIGVTVYQLSVVSAQGESYTSQEIPVFYTDEKTYVNFPNPVTNGFFHFLSPPSNATLQLVDWSGRIVKEFELINEHEELFVGDLSPGVYFFRATEGGRPLASGKILIQ